MTYNDVTASNARDFDLTFDLAAHDTPINLGPTFIKYGDDRRYYSE